MQWQRFPSDDPADPNGVADLLSRACGTVHQARVAGTRFLFRTSDMVSASREIELAGFMEPDAPMFVGVQSASRLMTQRAVYTSLVKAGVTVNAFGVGPAPDLPGIHWTTVEDDRLLLASQWFVVRLGEVPRALVGFELGEPEDQRRTWEGFFSSDPHLVRGLAEHLSEVASQSVQA